MARRVLPTFLYIGTDKAGSTWLYGILRQHPDCFVPSVKDIFFFDRHYRRGLEWYGSFFRDAPASAAAIGELSHDYLYSSEAPARIANDLPGVRLIVFLREPVERAFSAYLFAVRSGLTRKPFRAALDDLPEFVEHGRYAPHLERYFQLFGRDRVGVFFFDDLVVDPDGLARSVFDFLDVNAEARIQATKNPLPAARPRNVALARLAREGAQVARRLGGTGLVGNVKRSRYAKALYVPYRDTERPHLEDADREYLEAELAADTAELRRLLPSKVPAWVDRASSVGG